MAGSRVVLGIIAISFCIGLGLITIAPFNAFPDEPDHLKYAQYIRAHHAIPPLARETKDIEITESFQPPLFYICASLLVLKENPQATLLLIRIFSLCLSLIAVWWIAKAAEMVFPGNPGVAMLACAIAAFNPEYLWIHSGISNMSMSTFTSALTLFLAVRVMDEKRNPLRESIFLGLAMGATLLSRVLTVCLVPACALAILYRARQRSFLPLLAFTASMLLVCGWWYARNWIDYGDPLLWHIHQTTMGKTWARDSATIKMEDLITAPAFLHASFWAYFGRNQYHANIGEYAVYLLLVVLACVGVLEILFRRNNDPEFGQQSFQRQRFIFLLIAALIAIGEIMVMQLKIALPQGRYLYMVYVAFGVLFACGLLKIIPSQKRSSGATLVAIFLLLFCLYVLLRYAAPHYL